MRLSAARPLIRRIGSERQRVNDLHLVPQSGINHPVLLKHDFAAEFGADYDGLKVPAIANNLS